MKDREERKREVANRKAEINQVWRNKVLSSDRIGLKTMLWHQAGWEIVLTCGCFDVLHVGHLRLLRAAAAQGHILIVGINSDESVRALKGEQRPILPQQERLEMLANLSCVNGVVVFNEENPIKLIRQIKPNIYCKASDYKKKGLIEEEAVKEGGGHVYFAPFSRGHSTTGLIEKLSGMEGP